MYIQSHTHIVYEEYILVRNSRKKTIANFALHLYQLVEVFSLNDIRHRREIRWHRQAGFVHEMSFCHKFVKLIYSNTLILSKDAQQLVVIPTRSKLPELLPTSLVYPVWLP